LFKVNATSEEEIEAAEPAVMLCDLADGVLRP
jgi:hypothetical protein